MGIGSGGADERAGDAAIELRRTRRLLLRRPTDGDLDFHARLFAMSELTAHRPDPTPDDRATSAADLAHAIAHWQRHGFGRWAIEHGEALVGFGGLTQKAETETGGGLNLSYHLHPAAWGKGLASEMVAEALAVAFDILGATRVVGLVRPVNVASRRVLERAGFREEATIALGGAPSMRLVRTRG